MFIGDLKFNFSQILFFYFFIGIIGGEIGIHRFNAHNAFSPKNTFLEYVLISFGLFCLLGTPLYYKTQHKNHHINSDKNRLDIQSPIIYGVWRTLFVTQFVFEYASMPLPLLREKIYYTPFYKFTHRFYDRIIYATLLIIGIIDWKFLFGAFLPACLLSLYIFKLVNTFCHYPNLLSYRNYETDDSSQNNFILGVLSGGLGFHNNHHKHPAKYTTTKYFWEFDLSGFIIKNLISKKVNSSS